MPRSSAGKPWKAYGRYGSVGIELVASIMAGYYGGHWLDTKLPARFGGGNGYLTALFFVVGVYAGFRALFATAKHLEADIEHEDRRMRGEDPWKSKPTGPTWPPREPAATRGVSQSPSSPTSNRAPNAGDANDDDR